MSRYIGVVVNIQCAAECLRLQECQLLDASMFDWSPTAMRSDPGQLSQPQVLWGLDRLAQVLYMYTRL